MAMAFQDSRSGKPWLGGPTVLEGQPRIGDRSAKRGDPPPGGEARAHVILAGRGRVVNGGPMRFAPGCPGLV